jgi:hypothetical protein
MGKSMNPKMSGFRKWAEIHEPTKIDKARTGANEGGVIAAADVDQDRKTPEVQPHVHGLFPEHRAGNRWIVVGLVLALPGCAKTCD